jgi:hypothetical protein
MAGLSPTDYIRPVFDLGYRVPNAVPVPQRPHVAVTELHDCLTALDASA